MSQIEQVRRIKPQVKGQIQGQVFIYILTILVVGLLVIMGYRFFKGTISQGCDVQEIQFKASIENAFKQYTSYKSVNYDSFSAPCDFETACFLDAAALNDPTKPIILPSDGNKYYFVQDSAGGGIAGNDKAKRNIFLVKHDGTLDSHPIYSEQIAVDNKDAAGTNTYAICIDKKGGKFLLKFEGKGKTAQVSGQ